MVEKILSSQLAPGFLKQMPALYDISRSVGIYGCDNRRDDVLLVQYFLKAVLSHLKSPPLGRLAVDGIFGPVTHYWIMYFKDELMDLGGELTANPTELALRSTIFPISYKKYTVQAFLLFALNYHFWFLNKATFANLERDDASFPVELRQLLNKNARQQADRRPVR